MRQVLAAVIVSLVAVGAYFAFRAHTAPRPLSLQLADGTQAFFLSDTRVTPVSAYPQPRELRIDGDAFLRVPASSGPLVIRTRLLVLTVTGDSALRVMAYAKQTGEQVEVLSGHVQAKKSYPSTYSEPDELNAGEMSMINQTIDLMEKEKFHPDTLRKWSADLMAAAHAAAAAKDR